MAKGAGVGLGAMETALEAEEAEAAVASGRCSKCLVVEGGGGEAAYISSEATAEAATAGAAALVAAVVLLEFRDMFPSGSCGGIGGFSSSSVVWLIFWSPDEAADSWDFVRRQTVLVLWPTL